MELRLLNSLTDKGVYEGCVKYINPSIFPEELEDIMCAIQELHTKFDDNIDMEIVKTHIFNKKVSTTAKKALLTDIIDKIEVSKPVSVDIAKDFIFQMAKTAQRLEAMNKLAWIIEKKEDSHEEVINILSELPLEEQDTSEIVGATDEDLKEFYEASNRYPFSIDTLQRKIGGMSKGNLAIVFGRPEIGKSSFIAHMVAGYIKSGIIVEYYANEEPGRKIMLNIRRAVTGESDSEIVTAIQKKNTPKEWEAAYKNLTVRSVGTMGIDTIIGRSKDNPPDVFILDQVDKLTLSNSKNSPNHERLKELYTRTRELAKSRDCLVINVSQASIDADGQNRITYDMLDGSKTGKAGEADIIIGIGKNDFLKDDVSDPRNQIRYVTISKNKINGWHGMLPVTFNPITNQWIAGGDDANCY